MSKNPNISKIAIGSDHGGFATKQKLIALLSRQGYDVEDVGVHKEVSVDYPRCAFKVATLVSSGGFDRGIVIDGAGIGSCMAANKVPGIRAAMCYDVKTARNSREHNNANVLTLGGKLLEFSVIQEVVDVWLNTECTEARHLRRAKQIIDIERGGPFEEAAVETVEKNVNNLSPDDLAQIARQITEILQSQGISSGSGCTCCEGSCGGGCAENAPQAVQELISVGASRISYRGGNGQAVA
ncbi:MAG: RpiB/LacA/LacB family sugar-phosphate isomerase, partial [Calditrichota bacterium]